MKESSGLARPGLRALMLAWACAIGPVAAGTPVGTLEDLFAKLRDNEKRFQEVSLEWREEALATFSEAKARMFKLRGLTPPVGDIKYDSKVGIKLSGRKWRVDSDGKTIDGKTGSLARS